MLVAKERIQRLERDMRRLREGMLVLAVAMIVTLAWSLTRSTPDELKLRRLAIVDGHGNERIVAATRSDGGAGVSHYDLEGKMRIHAGIESAGDAAVQHLDSNGTQRITAGTGPAGDAALKESESSAKGRVGVFRFPDGYSGIAVAGSDGESVWMKMSE
jgi:hypothetical protein